MEDTYEYLVYAVNIGIRKDKYRRSYVSSIDVYFEIVFIEACSGKTLISLSRVVILRIEVEDVKKKCW